MVLSIPAQAQDSWQPGEQAFTVTIDGGSTLSGWSVNAPQVTGFPATLTLDPGEGATIEGFAFEVDVNSMDGGRGSAMNDKIKIALKSETNPSITFQQSGSATFKEIDGELVCEVTGDLSIAGNQQPVTVPVKAVVEGNQLRLSANRGLTMTQFEVTPPSAMFGQIVAEDSIQVNIAFNYQRK